MNAAENLLCTNSFSDAAEASIHKTHNAATFSARLTHDGHLSTGIHESFDSVTIYFTVLVEQGTMRQRRTLLLLLLCSYDVEHHDVTEDFRGVFHSVFHILLDILHARSMRRSCSESLSVVSLDDLVDPSLHFGIERIETGKAIQFHLLLHFR